MWRWFIPQGPFHEEKYLNYSEWGSIYFFAWSHVKQVCNFCLKLLKNKFFCRVSPISTRFFCHITCTFKHPCLQLFRFEIAQFVPFWIKNPQNPWKIVKKGTKRYLLFIKKVLLVGFEWAVTLNRSCKPAWHDLISFKWGHWH